MKRRQRRPVLDLSKGQAGSHGEYLQSKYKQITNEYPGQNVPANPLANLLCHYNSDSDTEDTKKDVRKLDDQVNNFLKEIQLIAPKESIVCDSNQSALTTTPTAPNMHHVNQQSQMWRECLDESSGYPYYWHIETNEVTWEMPNELRALKNDAKTNTVFKAPTVQDSHWVDFSVMTYQQSHENIPEGMIPREVVARNRNRYIRKEVAEKPETPVEQETANTSDAVDDDSDDGKIEMITSYGDDDESDSDTGENNQPSNETPAVPTSEPTNSVSATKSKNPEPLPTAVLPQLPKVYQKHNQEYESKSTANDSKSKVLDSKFIEEKDAYRESKLQVKQRSVDEDPKETGGITGKSIMENKTECKSVVSSEQSATKKRDAESDIDFRVSLVPGYDEDSDAEEEPEPKEERKPLFPILQNEESLSAVSLNKNVLSAFDSSRVSDSNDSDSNVERKTAEEDEREGSIETMELTEDSAKVESDSQKTNKFLDGLHGNSKCFQRKKRIAFDVPTVKVKVNSDSEVIKSEDEPQQSELSSSSDIENRSTESQKEACAEQPKECSEANESTTVESVKCQVKSDSSDVEEANSQSDTLCDKEEAEENEEEVSSLSQIVLEKLKFLSEGKQSVSPVQLMAIQLQTLSVAWEGGHLEKNYLRRWLTDTSHELERLEQEAAPPGWLCQWDRSHKRYYYQNPTTGATQWTYPDTGIAGGTEEMEICSTPPPADQEEITVSVEPVELSKSTTSKAKQKEDEGEANEGKEARASDIEAPPPPQISNPSPPPPPRIFAEDLKKDKRRRDKVNDKLIVKKKRLGEDGTIVDGLQPENPLVPTAAAPLSPQPTIIPNIANTEPLPPGVDLTEAPYEIPATALKRILYNTVQQQGNALYDATARDAAVSLLGHPAIVQEHYLQYPAYHQHLHAPAALVLSHKHSVQPAIQLMPDYTPIYTNRKVIEKPPVKTQKESLVSALDSFYNDIARIEKSGPEQTSQRQDVPPVENVPVPPPEEAKLETEQEPVATESTVKEKKRKKTRVGISKKHKEVSSMVAKWQKAQQTFEDNT